MILKSISFNDLSHTFFRDQSFEPCVPQHARFKPLGKPLTKELDKLQNVQNSFSVKLLLDFIKILKNVSLEDGEILVNFDNIT